jgi:hypothetical protein
VNHDPQIVIESNRDSLSNSADVSNRLAFSFVDRRIDRANDERIADPNLLDPPSPNV